MNTRQDEDILNAALSLAEAWQNRANELLTSQEKTIQKKMMRLLTHPMDKVILTRLIDQSFRSSNNRRVAGQINWLLRQYGIPEFFTVQEKALARIFLAVGKIFSRWSVPRMVGRMREDSGRVIVPGEPDVLRAHLQHRKDEGVRMNINFLGEAVLGEEEALKRLDQYIEALKSPDIEYISVKISTIYSQIQSLAFEHSVAVLTERLARLYRTARDNHFTRSDGTVVPKFVNLDMEEYRDLDITTAAFKATLDQDEFRGHSAGIVLQAYLPDSHAIQRELTGWARKRVAEGGSPVKLRIVKGANMETEQVESALHDWPLAPYDTKQDVDASYKRMVGYGMEPENITALHLGIASHNLFELAYAYQLAKANGVTEYFTFEMLEGMADHVRRAVREMTGDVLLYAPVAAKEQFINAIGYLIRRLDENTAPGNFLRYASNLTTQSPNFSFLKEQFLLGYYHKEKLDTLSHRIQNRLTETFSEKMGTFHEEEFGNEPDTDWSLAPNRIWAEQIRQDWKKSPGTQPLEIPLVVAGREVFAGRVTRDCIDPSQPGKKVCVGRFALANDEDVNLAVATAKADPDGWRTTSPRRRHEILSRVAVELRRARGDLIGTAAANTGKVFTEADPEVSEAIDFAEYYPFSARAFTELKHVESRGKGVGLVISPWNFPISIPSGGILASLSSGNTVIFKPSSDAVLEAWRLCRCFYDAGVSGNVLQFLPCPGSETGAKLTGHPDVDFVILTGGTDTGLRILDRKPGMSLSAETGGKNSTIVTAMSDRDEAIKNVVYSAFGNCGQKCSATSLLILEREVYEDLSFKRQLVDAVKSLATGSAWDFENRMGPLIHPPAGDLERALTRLEPGETWALQPQNVQDNPYLWTPGVKWGVRPGSYSHMTEFFGPVLGVMCADNLDHAIQLANQTGYGLTAGIESLDRREQERWKACLKAGNLYINRGTTGAVTLRQPFGGMGKSALGAGIKTGGPDYVAQFMDFHETGYPEDGPVAKDHPLLRLAQEWKQKLNWGGFKGISEDIEKTVRAVRSYLYRYERDFAEGKDFFHLRGQDNILRYLPVGTVVVRLHPEDTLFEVLARIAAARISGCDPVVSVPKEPDNAVIRFLNGRDGERIMGPARLLRQTDRQLVQMIPAIQRVRYAAPGRVPDEVFTAAAKTGFHIARTPVMMEGRIELLHYFQQQSICDTYHRYGNLGERTFI